MEKAKYLLGSSIVGLAKSLQMTGILSRATVFHPPSKAGYLFHEYFDEDYEAAYEFVLVTSTGKTISVVLPPFVSVQAYKLHEMRRGVEFTVPLIYLQNQSYSQEKLIIFSHGNSSDLGDNYIFLLELMSFYECNVLAYDYTGYGLAGNKPTETTINRDLECVLAFATQRLGIPASGILLWGFSLGAAPSVEIATKYKGIGGLILQSPLASLVSFLHAEEGNVSENQTDMFSIISKIGNVDSPICIVHGKEDRIIPIKHSHMLCERYEQVKGQSLFFNAVDGAKHNDLSILLVSPGEVFDWVFTRVQEMLSKQGTTNSNEEDSHLRKIYEGLRVSPDNETRLLSNDVLAGYEY
eukprot:TRINITY_DN11759_c0_g1_i11.p1 TRINITY_DN11759_c0_g1~~TRINITY_DN11759_c0_g1_i11.p1  ORF type:complete len:353 (-),score=57.57 TRINITY_DN11759_c0_g1_i11:121-1179(-)